MRYGHSKVVVYSGKFLLCGQIETLYIEEANSVGMDQWMRSYIQQRMQAANVDITL